MVERSSVLHHSHDTGLSNISGARENSKGPTSQSRFLASSTRRSVSLRSSFDSTLLATVWILILASGHEKAELNEKVSASSISRPLGDLSKILYLEHAIDCSVRFKSAVAIEVVEEMI